MRLFQVENSAIVPVREPSTVYVIQADATVETKYIVIKELSRQELIETLVKHFDKSIAYLQQRKKQIFDYL